MKLSEILKIAGEFLRIGKSTARGIQLSGDAALARRIKRAIAKGDAPKIRKIVERGGILVDGDDILGIWKSKEPNKPDGVLISVDMMVRHIMMKRLIKRYQRKE